MLKSYFGLENLKNVYQELPISGRIYTKPRIDQQNIRNAEFLVIPSADIDDYTKEIGGVIPNQISGKNYYSWLEAPTFSDIISLKIGHNSNATLDDFEEAIFYYLEKDTFLDE